MQVEPTVIDYHGTKYWFKGSRLHREDGPAKEFANGYKEWYYNGKLHREDGPAITAPISYTRPEKGQCGMWYKHGKIHRLDGPAVTLSNGDKEWWINGRPTGQIFRDEKGRLYEIRKGRWRLVRYNRFMNFLLNW